MIPNDDLKVVVWLELSGRYKDLRKFSTSCCCPRGKSLNRRITALASLP
jgi:hypothetical protein